MLVVDLQLLYSQSSIAGHKSKDGCTLTRDYLAVARDISVFYMWLKPSYTAGYYEHHKGAQQLSNGSSLTVYMDLNYAAFWSELQAFCDYYRVPHVM